MTVTINAAQLVRLIDKTVDHAGTEYIEQLHGIRLDKDATHLHAIASDRYTLAVARYKLADAELKGEPFARTIPLPQVKPLREWLQAMEGSQYVTISTDTSRLNFATADSELRVPVSDSLEFPSWRGILYTITGQTSEADTFPVLDSRFLARWSGADGHLHVRVSTDRTAVLLFGEDFIGAQMPARHGAFGSCTEATFDQARDLWAWTLAGGAPASMEDMPVEERPGWQASTDPRETGKGLLQSILRSSSDIQGTWRSDPDLFNALIGGVVHGWMAYRYLEGLHQADPRRAREIVAEVAEELDDGELAEWAWDTAEKAGHDPKQWAEDYQNAQAKKAGETRTRFTERLAEALNEARMAGVAFTAEDNPLVRLDEQRDEWTPVPVEPTA
ncbi:hypothetical protein [Streptomyces sp. NPDC127040]|uniref:hypothetical protein n=1 Tax=Streptomyces sp. NPDC127040 TaxID=3347116 RepID=UPI00365AC88B